MKKYYQLISELEIDGAWYFGDILDDSGKEFLGITFRSGKPFHVRHNLFVELSVPGSSVDYRFNFQAVPVVSIALAKVIERIDAKACQFIPVIIRPSTDGYGILNVLEVLKGLDYDQTIIKRFSKDDPVWPEKAGQIDSLSNLTIDPTKVQGHHIFLLAERPIVLIVSETLKNALEEKNFTGMKFIPA